MIKKILGNWHRYVLWTIVSVMFWGWIISLVIRAPESQKVTLFADLPAMDGEALEIALEREKPEGIKYVQAALFDYAIIDASEVLSGDLFLIPESKAGEYLASFIPIDRSLFPGASFYESDGVAYGLLEYDEEADLAVGAASGPDGIVVEEIRQHAGSPLISGEHGRPEALLHIGSHVVCGRPRVSGVARQLLCRNARERLRRQGSAAHGERVRHIHGPVRERLQKPVDRHVIGVRAHGHDPSAVELLHILHQLFDIFPCSFHAGVRPVEEDQGILRDVIEPARHIVQERQVFVRVVQFHPAPDPLGIGPQL